MMQRPEDIKQRIASIQQIEDIVVAMRGLAAAHSNEAHKHLAAIKTFETVVVEAIAHALGCAQGSSLPSDDRRESKMHLRIIIGAEQGFSGIFNDSIVEMALAATNRESRIEYMVVGQRSIAEIGMRDVEMVWTSGMVSQLADVPRLASAIADALFSRMELQDIAAVSLVSANPGSPQYTVMERSLIPFDFARFTPSSDDRLPMLMVPPQRLLENLVEEYVFCEICEALVLGFAAENDARMMAMTRARSNIEEINTNLQREFHQSSQEQITGEIIELSTLSD